MAKKSKGFFGSVRARGSLPGKVTLDGIRPLIWRKIQVRGNITLFKLHKILQVVMGWDDYHLHKFVIEGEDYSVICREAYFAASRLRVRP